MAAPAVLTRYRRDLDAYLRERLSGREPELLYQMARYHLGWEDAGGQPADHTGKALRPVLCVLSCEALGGDPAQVVPAAAAVELVHNFSLVHDDIQDRDPERHHWPTVWRLWGEAQAINAGDALLTIAHATVLDLVSYGVAPATVLAAARLLDERTLEMVEGQVMDLSFEDELSVDVNRYMQMISLKTGALFDCSLALGSMVAGAPAEVKAAMGEAGRQLGIAYQLKDDIMGVWGTEAATGKQEAADIRRRKKALPIVYAFERADGAARTQLEAVYGKPELDHEDVAAVLHVLERLGVREYCETAAAEARARTLSELTRLTGGSEAGRALAEGVEFLLAL